MPQLHPLIAVLGPTASGKSALAIRLAEQRKAEIVNYDSVQLYRGFDIGSAKTPPAERGGVPHHLIDVLEPTERTSAGAYARWARKVLAEIRGRGATPILVGGTGFYLKALIDGLFEGPAADLELRERLGRSAARHGEGYLQRVLARLDPESAERIHAHDQTKLMRAIEVSLLEGRPFSVLQRERRLQRLEGFAVERIGLAPPREALYERIDQRTQAMFEGGLLGEVEGLLAADVPADAWPFGAVGYRQALDCVRGRLSKKQAIEAAAQATRNYAKRQLTWFRNQEPETAWNSAFGDQLDAPGSS